MNKFGLSDSLVSAAAAILNGEQPEIKKEQEQLDEGAMKRMAMGDKEMKTYKRMDDTAPFEGGKKISVKKDQYGNVIKNRARSLARAAMKKQETKEETEVEEDMSVHLSMNKDGKSYTVKKEKTGGRLKKGESISDTHVDDLKDSGVKVHHESVGKAIGKVIGGAAKAAGKAVGGTAKAAGKVAGGTAKAAGKVAGSVAGGTAAAAKGTVKGVASGIGSAAKGTAKGVGSAVKGTAQGGKEAVKRTVAGIKEEPEFIMTEEQIVFTDFIAELSDEDFDAMLESMTDEELAELHEGILSAVGGLVSKAAGAAKRGVQAGAQRMSVQGRADAAERKTQKIAAKTQKVQDKMAAREKLSQQKSAQKLAKQKLKAFKQKAKEQKAGLKKPVTDNSLSKNLKQKAGLNKPVSASEEVEIEEMGSYKLPTAMQEPAKGAIPDKASNMGDIGKKQKKVAQNGKVDQNAMKNEAHNGKHLDPVGQEDDDIDNDGDSDKSDSYLRKRRAAIKKAITKKVNEAEEMKVKKTSGPDALKGPKLDASAGCPTVSEAADDDYMSPGNVQKRIDKAQKRQGMTFFQRYNRDRAEGKVSKTIDKDKFFGKKKKEVNEMEVDDGWYAHREMHGDKGVSKDDWKKGIRMNRKGEKVNINDMKKKKEVKEGVGEEETRSATQSTELAKHYYMKAKQAQGVGNSEAAGKYMSAAKKFYRKSEDQEKKEKAGRPEGQSESLGIPETYWSEIEIEELSAPELEEASGVRVTKAAKSEPEHIAMQARKVVSLGDRHGGVEFNNGKTEKVSPKTAAAALKRYNSAKPAEREEMQKHMAHSHDGMKHVASGEPLSKGPAATKKSRIDVTQFKRHGVASKSGHYN